MAELKFYRCKHCGSIAVLIEEGSADASCCGEDRELLIAGASDGAGEKHVPVVNRADGTIEVAVGEVEHPMLEEHSIQWIALASEDKFEIKKLHPGEAPKASFVDEGGDISVYEYCNLHGLWKTEA